MPKLAIQKPKARESEVKPVTRPEHPTKEVKELKHEKKQKQTKPADDTQE